MGNEEGNNTPTAFLVDLVSNRKIPVATPRCRVGRDDLNDIVISGDQSISRFHFIISYENDEFTVQDAKSRHGTFLNGNQITSPENIKDGDVLKVGVSLFWFVVEAAQAPGSEPLNPPTVAAISGERADGVGITVKGHPVQAIEASPMTDTSANIKAVDDGSSKSATQEMAIPDAKTLDKMEEAANSIQIEPKLDLKVDAPKASLASLLQPLATEVVQNNEDAVKAKLAAQDKELLEELDSSSDTVAESTAESKEDSTTEAAATEVETEVDVLGGYKYSEPTYSAAGNIINSDANLESESTSKDSSDDNNGEGLPTKVLNKPSDTVTLEALQPTGLASSLGSSSPESSDNSNATGESAISEAPVAEIEVETEVETKKENTKLALGDLLSSQEETTPSTDLQVQEVDQSAAEVAQAGAENEEDTNKETEAELAQAEPEVTVAESSTLSPPNAEISGESGSNGSATAKQYGESSGLDLGSINLDDAMTLRAGATDVPDWTKRYFSDEIAKLNTELDELNEQVKLAQQKIRDVETRVALTKGVRNTLLTTTGDELVEACGKVLSLIGWKVTIAADDKHELRLEVDDKHVCIARVIWTTTQAERSHLGQLSISQTRYWCEKGTEPKGILIVSKISDQPPTGGGSSVEEMELAEYAAKKNVCLMTTMQLLALYKEVALDDAKPDGLRTAIVAANGWLSGHDLEPGSAELVEKEDASQTSNKLSSLLSASS
ncbi:FHA domain-containing protein [bacterium]|nr:FHA domain-containing protein [bacterium]MBP9809896.1 FHA domain-containing protein [bacterium]